MNLKNSTLILSLSLALWAVPAASAAVPGDLDRSFGTDGKLLTELTAGNSASPFDAVVDSSGRLVVVGNDSGEGAVARFNPDGTPDTSFGGGDGVVIVDSGPNSGGERLRAVTLDGAGNIVAIGDASIAATGNSQDLVFVRLGSTGTPDASFDGPGGNGNGVFRLNLADQETAADLLVDGDGKIVFAAGTSSGPSAAPKVGRLESNGTLDTDEFASPDGSLTLDFQAGSGEFVTSLARQSADGKIIVGGSINGTATYAVARLTTAGALDTTFNSAGTIPGVARPALPAGFISSRVFDVIVDTNGITVAGDAQRGSPTFDREAMLSRLTAGGALDTAFGTTSGYSLFSQNTDDDESFSALSSLDGRLFVGGTAGPLGGFMQVSALYTSAGALDPSFASPGGLTTVAVGNSATVVSAPVSQSGVAYLVGNGDIGGSPRIAASAVCLFMPPACPSPETPENLSVTPAGGGNDNGPRVKGVLPAGAEVTGVTIYTDAACTGPIAATGSTAAFEGDGIQVGVPDNSTTTFYAKANGHNGDSGCSAGVSYSEVTPPAATQPDQASQNPVAKKKCKKTKKAKGKKNKKKCKRQKRR